MRRHVSHLMAEQRNLTTFFINNKWRHASRYENMEEKADIITTNGDMENDLKNRLNKAAQAISMLKEI